MKSTIKRNNDCKMVSTFTPTCTITIFFISLFYPHAQLTFDRFRTLFYISDRCAACFVTTRRVFRRTLLLTVLRVTINVGHDELGWYEFWDIWIQIVGQFDLRSRLASNFRSRSSLLRIVLFGATILRVTVHHAVFVERRVRRMRVHAEATG